MFRSALEKEIAGILGKDWGYETEKLTYTVEKKYTPDFIQHGEETNVYLEVKGYFRAGDTQKYKAIAAACRRAGYTFVFILQYPNKPVRKGARLSMAQWCDRHRIEWYSVSDLRTTAAYKT